MRIIKIALAIGCIILGTFLKVDAFNINPYRVEMTLPTGEHREGTFTVANPSDAPIKIKITVEDWSSLQEGRTVVRGEGSSLSWLKLNPVKLTLEPHQSETVRYTVQLPDGETGGRAAMIYFATVPEAGAKGISIVNRVGTALYAIAEGTEIIQGEIDTIRIKRTKPSFMAEVAVKNLGNIHIRPGGRIVITKKAEEILTIPFNEPGFPVFPEQRYIFETRRKEELDPGTYSLELIMEFGEEELRKTLEFEVPQEKNDTQGSE